ncbi:MAG: hypothetical protein AMXMBFR47_18000 [Planctomycetota bacterium]
MEGCGEYCAEHSCRRADLLGPTAPKYQAADEERNHQEMEQPAQVVPIAWAPSALKGDQRHERRSAKPREKRAECRLPFWGAGGRMSNQHKRGDENSAGDDRHARESIPDDGDSDSKCDSDRSEDRRGGRWLHTQ